MSYSRWAGTWPAGEPSWYIFYHVNGKLAIWPSDKFPELNPRDVAYLRDILNEFLEDCGWDEERGKKLEELERGIESAWGTWANYWSMFLETRSLEDFSKII